MTSPSDPSFTTVGDLAELTHDAFTLILDQDTNEARDWRDRFHLMLDQLRGNRAALQAQVQQAVGAASTCWSHLDGAGEFDSDRAGTIADALMTIIDRYADSLPLVRHASMIPLPEDDPNEALAKAIYELSAKASQRTDSWDNAPEDIKVVLRQVAAELTGGGILSSEPPEAGYPSYSHEAPDPDGVEPLLDWSYVDPQLSREEVLQQMNSIRSKVPEISEWERNHYAALQARAAQLATGNRLPPNIPMPEGFHSDSERKP